MQFTDNEGSSAFSTWNKARKIRNVIRRATIARINLITVADTLPNLKNSVDQKEKKGKYVY